MTVVTYDTSAAPRTLVLPSLPQIGDRIDLVATGPTGTKTIGQSLGHALTLDPAGKTLWGALGAASLDKAVQNFQLYFDGTGWWW